MKRVVVHIDRLVLNGIARKDRHVFAESLRGELGRLLAEPGNADRLASLPDTAKLNIRDMRVGTQNKPAQFAKLTANAITRGVKR